MPIYVLVNRGSSTIFTAGYGEGQKAFGDLQQMEAFLNDGQPGHFSIQGFDGKVLYLQNISEGQPGFDALAESERKIYQQPDIIYISSSDSFEAFQLKWKGNATLSRYPVEDGNAFLQSLPKPPPVVPGQAPQFEANSRVPSPPNSSFLEKAVSFFLHPGNYALMALLAVSGALLIQAGVIAGSVVAAIATGTLGLGLATFLALFVFLPLLALKDKAEMGKKFQNDSHVTYTLNSKKKDVFEILRSNNYSWKDYFLGHFEKVQVDEVSERQMQPASPSSYHRTGNLLSRLFTLAGQRPWRTAIATLGILASVAALTLGLGYLVAPAVFGFMASTFGLMTATLSTGLIGMAGAGGALAAVFALLATPAVVPAIAISLLVLLPLVVVNTIDRVMSAFSGDKKGLTATLPVQEDGVTAHQARVVEKTPFFRPVAWFLSKLPNSKASSKGHGENKDLESVSLIPPTPNHQ